jgi:peptide/nickel transport system substrate-binding protein
MKFNRRLLMCIAISLSIGAAISGPSSASTFTAANISAWHTENLNPFVASSLPLTNSAIYETLFYVNDLTNEVVPVLGTDYKWSADSLKLTVSVRDGVVWHDGQPFTAADVVFTYKLLQKFPALDQTALWSSGLKDVTVENGKVAFTFSEPNTPILSDLMNVSIVPEHIWASIKDPVAFSNEHPVGTGPFTFASYSVNGISAQRFKNYWMKDKPKIDTFGIVPTQGNDPAQMLVLKNQVYWFAGGITDPVGFAARGPNYKYWWPTYSFNFLDFNTAKAPLNDPALRRAIASSLNVGDIATKSYTGAIRAPSLTAVIPSQVKDWLDPSIPTGPVAYDPKLAAKMLTDAGYKLDADGHRLGLDGKPLPTFKILTGTGWGDYITMCQLIAESLKGLGISTTIDQQTYAAYMGAVQSGTYDMVVTWGWGFGNTPYDLFYKSFSPQFSADIGKTAISNITRYTNPAITAALESFRKTTDRNVQKAAINTIVKQVMTDMPWVPLTERPRFIQYNTAHFEGFPDAEHPYNSGGHWDASMRLMLLNLQPK